MHGAASQMDPAGTDLDEEEYIDSSQPQCFDGEAITGQQVLPMLVQKGLPGAALPSTHGCGRNKLAFEDVSNGGAPHTVPKLKQLAFDFAITPARVLSGQAHDQRFEFPRNTRPAYR